MLHKDRATDRVDSIIGKQTAIKGTVSGSGALRIEGNVEGEVVMEGDVVVAETAQVHATVSAKNVTIAGTVVGNISASGRVELTGSARLRGDIQASQLTIQEGARFDGASRMNHDGELHATA